MTKKPTNCLICEHLNQASICAPCVNYRLNEYHNLIKSVKSRRDHLYSRLVDLLVAKGKADDQSNWMVIQIEKLARLREILRQKKEQLLQGKAKMERISSDLKLNFGALESSFSALEKNCVEQLEKSNPSFICAQNLAHVAINGERQDGSSGQFDQICNARLPRGLDPLSVPSDELAASLGKTDMKATPPSSDWTFLNATELGDAGENECLIEGWEIVEHPLSPAFH